MKRFLSLFATSLFGISTEAKTIDMTDFMDRLAIIESNGNYKAVGDNGKAIGMYQMHEEAYKDALAYVRIKGDGIHELLHAAKRGKDWKKDLADPDYARYFAVAYVHIIVDRLIKDKQEVTPLKIYMCYNMGYRQAKSYGFDPKHQSLTSARRVTLKRASMVLASPLPR
jgi:hypothetical protein